MRFPQIRFCLKLVRPLGLAGLFATCAILASGYVGGAEWLFRPLAGGPATHPLTAIGIALLGLSAISWQPYRCGRIAIPAAAGAVALGVARLVEIVFGVDLLGAVTPFQDVLAAHAAAGKPIATGANTAAMVVLMGAAAILNCTRRSAVAQFLAFAAIGFPLVSITGYAYGVEKFYGRMALSTVVAALPVGLGILLAGAHRGIVRSILSPWVGGRIARVQILLAYAVPFVIGYALLATNAQSPGELFGLFIVLVSAFVSCLIAFSASIQEHVDRSRRRAERELAFAATRDPLTELPNRRLLFDEAPRELDRAARNNSPVSVLMLDIDHFKDLNDRYGHGTGDRVLKRIAELMRIELRRQDLPARYGGEEFVVLLPDTPIDGAAQLAEKLRQRIAEEHFDGLDRDAFGVTISIGCAEKRDDRKLHQLIELADDALYRAKALGRNRVEVAHAT